MRSASVGVHVAAGEHDVEGARRADGTGQEVAQAQLARGEAVVDPRGSEVGRLRGDADVGGDAEAEPTPDGGTADGADDGLVHLADGPDDVVEELHRALGDGGAGEPGDVGDDAGVLEIRPRAERPARAGEDHDAGVVVGAGRFEGLSERDHHVEGHGVHALGPVQRDQRHVRTGLVHQDEGHRRSAARTRPPGHDAAGEAPRRRKVLQ